MHIYESRTVSIEYIEEQKYIYMKWKDYTLASDFREIIDFKADFILTNNINLVLTDITEHRVFAPSEQDFDRNVTVLLYSLMSNYKNAIIMNPKSAAAASAFRFKRMVNDVLKVEIIRLFETEEEALDWLLAD